MIEILIKIANVITICSILCFAGYLWSTTKEMKYHVIGALVQYISGNKEQWRWFVRSEYFNIYLLVPALLITNVILISQFANDTYKIRLDFQFFINVIIWIFLFRLFKRQHDVNIKLKQKLHESDKN